VGGAESDPCVAAEDISPEREVHGAVARIEQILGE
jgi:hypothetical protein